MTNHIETYSADNLLISYCLVCGDANAISDKAERKDIRANDYWFSGQHKRCADAFKARAFEAATAKVEEILASNHVAAVEVGFEESFGNVRVYSAVTRDSGMPHLYRVRVEDSFETGERVTTAKCNCPAGAKVMPCRHVIKVAEVDAEKVGREIFPDVIAGYQAHKNYRRAA